MTKAIAKVRRILSFWTGVDSIGFDGRLRQVRRPQASDDVRRLRGDWRAVGADIQKAAERDA